MKTSRSQAFTLVELLVVIAIIAILASLVLAAAGYIQKKSARAKAEAQIAALGIALESYKTDNGDYPANSGGSSPGSAVLVTALMSTNGGKPYYSFSSKTTNANGFVDPFGYDYNYTYFQESSPNNGTNNYDLWSTAGGSASSTVWIKNW